MTLSEGYAVASGMAVKKYLHNFFTIKDLGDAQYFLGLEIAHSLSGTFVAQTKYIHDIITDTGLLHSNAISTPFPQGLKHAADCGVVLQQPNAYRRLIGKLLYLSFTRLDISYSVQQLSQFLSHPCEVHWTAALHVVKYPLHRVCFFLPLCLLRSVVIVILTGQHALTPDALSSVFVFCSVPHLFPEKQRNSSLFPHLRWRRSIVVWLLLYVNFAGFHIFYRILGLLYLFLFPYSATTRPHYISRRTQCSMSTRNILSSTVT
ncbi:Retrovirus-related Pol polyprotein from transposon RE2 [Sesamum angolense]|uniref:Retrovirus-related Pol polyprotein from transposon RE2 n=1 Tax=Sesamum angolense TaxID=2727404 RepID=A0AAE2BK02_9LAMI|nr:Retrovirus-related Pol polyprotein from transposon RE2 [Sesamum angolense]